MLSRILGVINAYMTHQKQDTSEMHRIRVSHFTTPTTGDYQDKDTLHTLGFSFELLKYVLL